MGSVSQCVGIENQPIPLFNIFAIDGRQPACLPGYNLF